MLTVDNYNGNIILSSGEFETEKSYWLEKLNGDIVMSGFPYTVSQTGKGTYKEGYFNAYLSLDISKKIISISNNSNYALYTILLSGVKYILYRYNANNDVIVGMPVFAQKNKGEYMKNYLALRSFINDEKSFKDLLTELRSTVMEADKNQNISFANIAKLIGYDVESGCGFKTIVAMENIHDKALLDDIEPEISFLFSAEDEKIKLSIKYNENFFERSMIEAIVLHYENFYKEVFEDIGRSLSTISLLRENEKTNLLYNFNDTKADYPQHMTVNKIFEEQAKKNPGKTALVMDDVSLSYEQLNNRVNNLAWKLKEMGVSKESIVAVILYRSIEMIIAALAVLKAGGAYLPIDPDYPGERIAFTIEDSKALILLTHTLLKDSVHFEGDVLCLDDEASYDGNTADLDDINTPQSLAYIIYTSGTTGKPKGVMIEHRNLVRLFFNDKNLFDFNSEDVWTMFHSFCFDFSVWEMYGALLYGGKLVIVPKHIAQDPRAYLELLKNNKVTVLNQTPTAFYNLIKEECAFQAKDLCIRYIIFGGEALKPIMLKPWKDKYVNARFINMYGITETTVHVTYKQINEYEIENNISNIGKPIPTLTTYIMDSKQRLLPIGVPGEICVGGDGVGRGYLNRAELTLEKFVINPYNKKERLYRSGDLARMLDNGEMEYLGRIDHQVKIRGFRIELGEIESVILRYDLVREVVVLVKEEDGNKFICAYVVPKEGYTFEGMREYALRLLPDYMVPSYFVKLDSIPLTSNGKVDRKALPDPKSLFEQDQEYIEPENDTEVKIANIWSEVLGLERISVTHNFFSLGGDSIKAIGVISKTNKEFGVDLQIKDLYANQTVKTIAGYVLSKADQISSSEYAEAVRRIEDLKNGILARNDALEILGSDFEDLYPMSDIQRGMVYHAVLNPGIGIYHDQFIYQISDGNFDLEVFKKAMGIMANKHSIFRTGFNIKDFSEPVQIVYKNIVLNIEHEDISHMSKDEQKQYIEKSMEEDRQKPFEIYRAPLWHIKLFSSNGEVCMCWIFHHAILDGWSNASFVTELSNIYFRLKEEDLVPNKLQNDYKEFIIDQQMVKNSKEVMEYWRQDLRDYKRLTFGARKTEGEYDESRKSLTLKLDNSLIKRLKEVEKEYNTDTKTVCFAAYCMMMSMMSYDNDILVGLIEHNRPVCEDGDKILGCFLNTVPVRIVFEKNMTWGDYLRYICSKVVELKYFGKLPLFEILKTIGENPNYGNPLFDTIFNYVDFHVYKNIENTDNMSNNFEIEGFERTNTYFDFSIVNTFSQFNLNLIYLEELFTANQVEKLVEYFLRTLRAFIEEPLQRLDKRKLLNDDEYKLLTEKFNDTKREFQRNTTIPELFNQQVVKNPEKIAVIYNDIEITYKELDERAKRLAGFLSKKGVKSGSIVAVMAEHCPQFVIGILAVLKSGAAYVPIDPNYPTDRIRYMLEDCGAKIILSNGINDLEEFSGEIINLDDENVYNICEAVTDVKTNVYDIAYIIYTSGSTGKPKGVMLEHKGIANLKTFFIESLGILETDRIVQFASSSFDASVWETFMALLLGATLCIASKDCIMNFSKFEEFLNKNEVTVATLPPTYLVNLDKDNIKTLRKLITAGSSISEELLYSWKDKVLYVNAYGPTETTICATFWNYEEGFKKSSESIKSVPIGKPIDNTLIYILDKNNNIQPLGIAGELCVAGETLAKGYLNRQELTLEKFVINHYVYGQRLYRTGDLARWLPDGNIEFLGRIDYQVKIRGFRVELGEIENELLKHKSVKEAAVIDREDIKGNKYLCAYVVLDEEESPIELKQYLSNALPDYMVPAYITVLDKMPLTPNDKIDRKALPQHEKTESKVSYCAPSNETEEILLEIWKEVLEASEIGINHNFFDLGGDSIKAIQMSARLYRYGLELDIKDLFMYPTVAELSKCVKASKKESYQGIVEGYGDLLPIQSWFLNQNLKEMHHFNQSVMIYSKEGFEEEIICEVFKHITQHHDALRTVFKRVDNKLMQYVPGTAKDAFNIEVFDFTEDKDFRDRVERECDRIQGSMDIENGPLVRLGLFKTSEGNHLLMAIHHLVVDAVSWRILFEDLALVYNQVESKQQVKLPLKTDSYMEWSKVLVNYSKNADMKKELSFWKNIEDTHQTPLPRDFDISERTQEQTNTLSITLDRDYTDKLLGDVNFAYNTEINDTLLAALGLALKEWTGGSTFKINMEGHGREPFGDMNITRTVGWFTSIYPVLLDVTKHSDYKDDEKLAYHIKNTKENLRRIPNKGLGYGILKNAGLLENSDIGGISSKPYINFNYLGQFGSEKDDNSFTVSHLSMGRSMSKNMNRFFELDINGVISEGELEISVSYSKNEYVYDTVLKLAEAYKKYLMDIVDHCVRKDDTELTPTDLGNGELSLEEVQDIEDFFDNL